MNPEDAHVTHVTRKEKYLFRNNLVCLAKALEKRYTTIDLRNEICITGKIIEVDGYMNIVLSDAAVYDPDGKYRYFSLLHIQARNIRNIHIPDNISIRKTIKSSLEEEPKKQINKKRTFKESRALKNQKETLELIKQMKEKQNIKNQDES